MLGSRWPADVHVPTVLAIGALCYALTATAHEVVGHGGMCLLLGGSVTAVSSTELRCEGLTETASLTVTGAGSAVNILVGVVAMALGLASGPARGTWSYFLWLFGATNLFHAGTYMLIGPLTGFGDWSHVAGALEPAPVPMVLISALGLGLCMVSSRLAAAPAWQPLLGHEPEERASRMHLMTLLPLAAALVVSLAAGVFSPLQYRYALLSSLLAPLTLLWLVRLPSWPRSDHPTPAVPIRANWPLIALATATGVGFVTALGPGLGSFAGHSIVRG